MEITYDSEELIKCFLIQNKEHIKFCQIFLLSLQIFLQTRFAGLRRNLDSEPVAQIVTVPGRLIIELLWEVKTGT